MKTPSDQHPDDIRLARALYPRVEQRSCYWFGDSGRWEPAAQWGTATLWCATMDGCAWLVIPAYGEDEAAAFWALNAYCQRKGLYHQIEYLPSEDDHPAERYVTIQRLGGRHRAVAEGSTFALAARAAILDMEAQDA